MNGGGGSERGRVRVGSVRTVVVGVQSASIVLADVFTAHGGHAAEQRAPEKKNRRLPERTRRGPEEPGRRGRGEGSNGDEEIGTRREWDEEVRDGCRVGPVETVRVSYEPKKLKIRSGVPTAVRRALAPRKMGRRRKTPGDRSRETDARGGASVSQPRARLALAKRNKTP